MIGATTLTVVDNAYFQLIAASGSPSDGPLTFASSPATGGPWSAEFQHGGPPNALLVHCAEQLAAGETGRGDLHALRLAAEFLRPVPVGEITVTARTVRVARTAVLVDTTLAAEGRDCLHGRVWLVRATDTSSVAPVADPQPAPPEGLGGVGADFPYGDSIEWRSVYGGLHEPGPALVWARPRIPLLAGVGLTGLQRAALIGDSASGVSAELDWNVWSFANIDLDVHMARPVQGDWLLLDARTTLAGSGAALARSIISDTAGVVGSTSQTLVVEPRAR